MEPLPRGDRAKHDEVARNGERQRALGEEGLAFPHSEALRREGEVEAVAMAKEAGRLVLLAEEIEVGGGRADDGALAGLDRREALLAQRAVDLDREVARDDMGERPGAAAMGERARFQRKALGGEDRALVAGLARHVEAEGPRLDPAPGRVLQRGGDGEEGSLGADRAAVGEPRREDESEVAAAREGAAIGEAAGPSRQEIPGREEALIVEGAPERDVGVAGEDASRGAVGEGPRLEVEGVERGDLARIAEILEEPGLDVGRGDHRPAAVGEAAGREGQGAPGADRALVHERAGAELDIGAAGSEKRAPLVEGGCRQREIARRLDPTGIAGGARQGQGHACAGKERPAPLRKGAGRERQGLSGDHGAVIGEGAGPERDRHAAGTPEPRSRPGLVGGGEERKVGPRDQVARRAHGAPGLEGEPATLRQHGPGIGEPAAGRDREVKDGPDEARIGEIAGEPQADAPRRQRRLASQL